MSKKRWKQPNELLWSTVMIVSFFMMSCENDLIMAVCLIMMGLAAWKLRGVDLEEEIRNSMPFNDR